ncbi:hypothetical protein [Formosa algae]|uniref:hypothetical protein n=1 Tax=Formosa algae TaxID=225843 RepID=UPI000CCEF66C|nr:hypothetical protein [Formosa algae]PNW27235.1 hypothetical protein BKP44_14185 [Formosa algae]
MKNKEEENETVNVNNTDGSIVLLAKLYSDINKYWASEVNSNGSNFDFDSQDIYRHLLENVMFISEIIEKINPETEKEERIVLLEHLHKSIIPNITIYKKHIELFKKLPRKKLELNEFRKRKYPESTKNDKELESLLYKIKEIQNREKYFSSDLYNNIGFLTHNFHEELYLYSCYINKLITTNFKNFKPYDKNYLMIHDKIFFNMGIVYQIHKNYNNLAFEEISELELYKVLNLQNTISYLEIKNINRITYIFHKLQDILPKHIGEQWLIGILKEIKYTKKHYYSKYRIVKSSSATEDEEVFANEVDTLFNEKVKPLTS